MQNSRTSAETDTDQLLTTAEVAALLRVHAQTLRNWANTGQVESVTLPSGRRRYRRAAIEAILSGTPAA